MADHRGQAAWVPRRAAWERWATVALVVVLLAGIVTVALRWDATWALVTGWGIDPRVYAALTLVPLPLFWVSAFRVKRAAFALDGAQVWTWVVVNRCVAAVPLAYAIVAGTDLPGPVRPLLVVYAVLGAGTLVWRTARARRSRPASGPTSPGAGPQGPGPTRSTHAASRT